MTIFTTYELFKSDFSGYEGFFSFFRKTFFGRRVDVNCNSRALADTRFRTKFLSKLPVGSVDTFQIFIWSLKTGRLLDILAGHQGPVTSLAFSPESTVLVSGSWDKTVRMWDV